MSIRPVLTVLILLWWPAPSQGQVSPYEPVEGFVSGIGSSALDMFTQCATELEVDHVGPWLDLGCSVVDSTRLGSGSEPEAWMLKYRRNAVLGYDDFADTLAIDELALVRRDRSDNAVEPLWHLTRIQTYEFLERVESAERDEGVLVSYLTCLNGTGGCAQHFLLGRATWEVVEQPYLDALQALLPRGWSLHKGRLIDLASLRGVQPIAGPGDANCCPSGQIDFQVELADGALRLVSAIVDESRVPVME